MNHLLRRLVGGLLLLPCLSQAELIKLVCTDGLRDVSMFYTVDTSAQTVTQNDEHAQNVSIDREKIVFTVEVGKTFFVQSINRVTGIMRVQTREGLPIKVDYRCDLARPKF